MLAGGADAPIALRRDEGVGGDACDGAAAGRRARACVPAVQPRSPGAGQWARAPASWFSKSGSVPAPRGARRSWPSSPVRRDGGSPASHAAWRRRARASACCRPLAQASLPPDSRRVHQRRTAPPPAERCHGNRHHQERCSAPRPRACAISSTKSMHGHAMGASGALELIAAVLALRHGVAPPTAHSTAERIRMRSRLRAERGAPASHPRRTVQFVRLWRAQRRAGDQVDGVRKNLAKAPFSRECSEKGRTVFSDPIYFGGFAPASRPLSSLRLGCRPRLSDKHT